MFRRTSFIQADAGDAVCGLLPSELLTPCRLEHVQELRTDDGGALNVPQFQM